MNEAAAPSPARGGRSGFAFGVPNQLEEFHSIGSIRETRIRGTRVYIGRLLVVESQKVWFQDNTTFKIGAAATVS